MKLGIPKVPNAIRLPRLIYFACVRERYPLTSQITSQLIQKNKSHEFGEYPFDRDSI
jgi:hypothetical protein